ncbi:MAG TPA: Hpt domain-containing protein [Candidatus Binataceae bacterium]|nr:Hpt domain-containing protein [Candidatus Binataceae bacterium]
MPEKVVVEVDQDLSDLIPGFLTHKRADIQTIIAAAEHKDYEVIDRLSHRLKGEGASYGFPVLTDLGRRLEDASRHHDLAAVNQWASELQHYLERVEVVYHPSEG